MRFALNTKTNARENAYRASKDNAFICPMCKLPVILKQGSIKTPHFAHKTLNAECRDDFENSMSEWHIDWQNRFPEENQEIVIGNHRADICYGEDIIEFQHSNISATDFMARTKFYIKQGYTVIWVFDLNDEFEMDRLEMYDDNKWAWKYPSKTFIDFNPKFDYWERNVFLMFQVEDIIYRVVWCIHKWDAMQGKYINDYSRFCTFDYRYAMTQDEFVDWIKKRNP